MTDLTRQNSMNGKLCGEANESNGPDDPFNETE